jgi:hypothetical protein
MSAPVGTFRESLRESWQGWNWFWFQPSEPHTLALIRILAGSMLFYTHLVWGLELPAFLGADGWLPNQLARDIHQGGFAWSYLWYVESPGLLWVLHGTGLIIFAMLTLGLYTRVTAVLAWIVTVSYCQRLTGAFFGLDQVNAMLALYLMLGPSGAVYSLDAIRRRRAGEGTPQIRSPATISANIAVRLIQVHLCVIYLFGGIAKMRGQTWMDGTAIWYSVANLEYQSIDLTWMVHYPRFGALLSHLTVFWETFYCVLIWPRQTRPLVLMMALAVHLGIAGGLGMMTFGLAMLIANLAFVAPATVRRWAAWVIPDRS